MFQKSLRLLLLSWVFSSSAFCIFAVDASDADRPLQPPMKIGFVLVGPVTDWGYNYAHNQGRLYVEKMMPRQVVTTLAEKIPENAEAERVLERMIAQGNKLIFTTSYGYLEPTLRVAARHPDVVFVQANRPAQAKNVGACVGCYYEPMYISGMVAGRMTKSNVIGFIGGHPVPPLIQLINAFTLGAHSVNPKVKVRVVWINTWADPPTEAEAAKGLLDIGADVLVSNLDSSKTVSEAAEGRGAFSVGTHADLCKIASKGWLTGASWNWGPLYLKIAKSVSDGSWKPGSYLFGMKEGYVTLSSIGPAVPKPVRQEALALEQRIKRGQFIVFQGPLKDRDGKERLSRGQTAEPKWLSEMNWFVAGVEGTLPKK